MEEQNTFMDDDWASLLMDSSTVPLADIDISAFANLSNDMLDPFRDDTTVPQDGAGAAVDVELGNRPFNEAFPLNTTDALFCDEGGDIRAAGGTMLVDTPPSGRSSPEPLASVDDHGLPYLVQGGSHGADGSSDGDCASGDCRSGDCGSGGCKEGSSQIGSPWHQSSHMSAHPFDAAVAAAAPSCAAIPPSNMNGVSSTGGLYAGILPSSQFPKSTVKQEAGSCPQQYVAAPFAMQSVSVQGVPFPGSDAATCTVVNGGLSPGNAASGAENAVKECDSGGAEARGSVAGGGSGAAVTAEDAGSEPSEGDAGGEGGEGGEGEGEGEGEGRDPETEKREARLIRNRESAQLSRQRKKYYMDELEAQIRTMSAAVAELNSAVAHLTAENLKNVSRPESARKKKGAPGGSGAKAGGGGGEKDRGAKKQKKEGDAHAPALALAMFGFLLILCPFLPPSGELTRGMAPAYPGWQGSVMSWQGNGGGIWGQVTGAWRDGWRWWGGGAQRSEGRGGVPQGEEWGGGLGGGGSLRPGGRVLLGVGEEEEGGEGRRHAVGGDGLGVWWRGRRNGSMSGSVAQQQHGRALHSSSLHASALHSSSLDASALNPVWRHRVVTGARVEKHAADRQQQRFPAFAAVSRGQVPNLTAGRASPDKSREGRAAAERVRAAGKALVPWRQWSPVSALRSQWSPVSALRSQSAGAGRDGRGGSGGSGGSARHSGSGIGGTYGPRVSGSGSGGSSGSASVGLRAGIGGGGGRVAGALPGAAAVEGSLPWDQQHWQQWLLQHSSGPLFQSHTCTELFRFDSQPTQAAQEGEAQDEAGEATTHAGASSVSSKMNSSGGCVGSSRANSSATDRSRGSGSHIPGSSPLNSATATSGSSSSRLTEKVGKESFPPVPVPVLSRRMFLRRRYLNELPASKQAIPLPDSNQAIPLLPPTDDTDAVVNQGERHSSTSSTRSVDVSSSLKHNATTEGSPIRSVPAAVPGQPQQSGFRQQGAFTQPEPVVVSILSGFDASSVERFFQSGTRGFAAGFAGADGGVGSERVNAGQMGKGGAEEEEVRGGMGGSVVVMVTSGGKSVAYACALGGSKGRSKDFVDIVLSKTQRGTPTVIHKGSAVNRIRQFYMRKVKFTQQTFHDKLTTILDDFPRLEEIHPFYGDLLNVLYDKDHYKLALGQVNVARGIIDRITKEYVRLLKYGDSLYRCKQLKRAALGRMCTLMRKQGPSLAYLEQVRQHMSRLPSIDPNPTRARSWLCGYPNVRQHMSRLPSIDPNTRTILVCGYPNVGKSSFVNKVTRADVEVQPYAFTTKSLFVGHTDYKYLRWQVIDTPGILDHPLEERNTIEMLAVTALAHLRAAVLFVVDASGSCGYTLEQQAALFNSIKPLFLNKPLMVVCNKVDLQPLETLSEADRKVLHDMAAEAARCGGPGIAPPLTAEGGEGAMEAVMGDGDGAGCLLTMSTMTDVNVAAVKNAACERLLQMRVEAKMRSKRVEDVANRIHVAMPRPRDSKPRPPVIPQAVLDRQAKGVKPSEGRKLEKDYQEELGGAGAYVADHTRPYLLGDDTWRHDVVPEIMDGKNIADFVDADILARLEELEREEWEMEQQAEGVGEGEWGEAMDDEEDLAPEEAEALAAIRWVWLGAGVGLSRFKRSQSVSSVPSPPLPPLRSPTPFPPPLLPNTRLKKKRLITHRHRQRSVTDSRPILPRHADTGRQFTAERMRQELSSIGLDPSAALARIKAGKTGEGGDVSGGGTVAKGRKRSRSMARDGMEVDGEEGRGRRGVSRGREGKREGREGREEGEEGMELDEGNEERLRKRIRHMSRSRSQSLGRIGGTASALAAEAVPGEGFRDTEQKVGAIQLARKHAKKRNVQSRKGEADRTIVNVRPKHLFAGKRGIGKTDRR
ncbi:unnamed protein product [Closterium sp. Naga37s-1]|nr:unnamed protein product [Closterium sp. Naga37s-1]